VFMASAGGLFPMPIAPIYAATKAALVHFVRSAAPGLARRGVRLCAVCPQPVDTPMVQSMVSAGLELPETGASLLTPERVRPRSARFDPKHGVVLARCLATLEAGAAPLSPARALPESERVWDCAWFLLCSRQRRAVYGALTVTALLARWTGACT